MDFLGLYNLFMALAIAGACGASGNYDAACDDYGVDSGYTADSGGADTLPPAWTVIDRPPTMVDNGYNPAFYWNRPDNDYADDGGYYPGYGDGYGYADNSGYGDRYADNGYAPAYRGYSAAYPAYAAAAPEMNYGAATTDAGYEGAYAEYDTGYDVEANGYGYYQRPIPYEREHRERRAAMARMPREQMHDAASDMPAMDYDRGTDEHRTGGYNGHDRHMFQDNHAPAKPAAANYQSRDNKSDGHNRPHE